MPPVYQFEKIDSAVGTARGARLLLRTTRCVPSIISGSRNMPSSHITLLAFAKE